jgi:hypothetical protein
MLVPLSFRGVDAEGGRGVCIFTAADQELRNVKPQKLSVNRVL